MTSTSPTDITIQDSHDDVLSTPLGTENIPPVRPAPINAPTQPEVNVAISQAEANQPPVKIVPTWVYFSVASAAVLSVVYGFKHFA